MQSPSAGICHVQAVSPVYNVLPQPGPRWKLRTRIKANEVALGCSFFEFGGPWWVVCWSGVKKADMMLNLTRWMETPERIGGKGYRRSSRRKVSGPRGRSVLGWTWTRYSLTV